MGIYRATFAGTLGLSEQFAFGWAFADDLSDDPTAQLAPLQSWLTAMLDTATAGSTWKNTMNTSVLFSTIRVQRYTGGSVVASTVGPAVGAGISATTCLPYEVSPCVTLVSQATGDTPKRGRFYLPPLVTNSMDSGTGNWNTTTLNTIRGALATAFDAFVTADRRVGILRAGGGSQAFSTAYSVDFGSVPDSQRRRRNKIVESRLPHVLV